MKGDDHIPVYIALALSLLLNVTATQVDANMTNNGAQPIEEQAEVSVSVNASPPEPEQAWETWELTAYTDSLEENGGWDKTASGEPFKDDYTLACPKSLPFGTEIEIEGIGVRTCEDRGGAIKGKRLDVFIRDADEMRRFGRQERKVRVLE